MKALISALSMCFLVLFFSSCDDDNPITDIPEEVESFQLKEGNYWIYTLGDTIPSRSDTTRVVSTELINGIEYFLFESTSPVGLKGLVRDSSGYLVYDDGEIIFSYDENYDGASINLIPESNPIYEESNIILPDLEKIVVEAGEFDCRVYQSTLKHLSDPTVPDIVSKVYYAKGVGMIRYRYAYTSTPEHYIVERLVEYKID